MHGGVSFALAVAAVALPTSLRAQWWIEEPPSYCEAPMPPNDPSVYESPAEFQRAANDYFDAANRFYRCISDMEIRVRAEWNAIIEEELRRLRESLELERDTRLDELRRQHDFVTEEVNRTIQSWVRSQ